MATCGSLAGLTTAALAAFWGVDGMAISPVDNLYGNFTAAASSSQQQRPAPTSSNHNSSNGNNSSSSSRRRASSCPLSAKGRIKKESASCAVRMAPELDGLFCFETMVPANTR